jgi:hypothetical protein
VKLQISSTWTRLDRTLRCAPCRGWPTSRSTPSPSSWSMQARRARSSTTKWCVGDATGRLDRARQILIGPGGRFHMLSDSFWRPIFGRVHSNEPIICTNLNATKHSSEAQGQDIHPRQQSLVLSRGQRLALAVVHASTAGPSHLIFLAKNSSGYASARDKAARCSSLTTSAPVSYFDSVA